MKILGLGVVLIIGALYGATYHHNASAKPATCPAYTPRMSKAQSQAIKKSLAEQKHIDAKGYQLDHIIPLELSGSNDSSNLQLTPWSIAKKDDRKENELHTKVCNGTLSLSEAQQQIKDYKTSERN